MRRLTLLLMLVFVLVLPVSAQESDAPLFDLLSWVPDTEMVRNEPVRYQDFRAVENAREYLSRPESGAAFLASTPTWRFTMRWVGAPDSVRRNFALLAAEMPETVGFDFFDIDQTLTFSQYADLAVVWSGDFDTEPIGDAHAARGYQPAEIGGVPAWCGAEGCAARLSMSFDDIEHGNPFDSMLGRQVPFLTLPETLVSSTSFELLQGIAAAHQDQVASLADSPDYRVLAEALTDASVYSGELVSAVMLPSTLVMESLDFDDPASLNLLRGRDAAGEAEAGELEQLAEEGVPDFVADYGDLPPYLLAAMADRQEGDAQVAVVALVYETADEAQRAAPELASRISAFSNALFTRSNTPLIEDLSGVAVESRVYTSETTGYSVAVVDVSYPTPAAEDEQRPLAEDGTHALPAELYIQFHRTLVDAMYPLFYPFWIVNP